MWKGLSIQVHRESFLNKDVYSKNRKRGINSDVCMYIETESMICDRNAEVL